VYGYVVKIARSPRHTANSSHSQLVSWRGSPVTSWLAATSHLVTLSSRHRSTRHTRVSSHSQLVISEHITKPPVPVVIICRPSGDIQKSRNSAQHGQRNYHYLCYFNVYCSVQITATDYTSTKSTVNSSQRCETQRSSRRTVLRCDELTGSLTGSQFCHGVKVLIIIIY